MKVFALLLFAGVSLAAFRGEEGLKVPADLHLKGYQPLNTYKYQYEACLTSGFPDTEQQYAGLKIVCDTEFYFGGDDSAFLKIKNPQLFEVNGTSENCCSESLKISPVTEKLAPLLEKPIKFQYRDGKVKSIYCSDDEPEYVLNIKRGILSLINHNFTRPEEDDVEPRMYKNWEYGSYGLCENLFDVQHLTLPETSNIGEMRISKILNLESCKEKPYVMANGNTGIRCLDNSCNIIDKPLKISITTACDMLGKESNFMVRMCETVSNYVYAPTQMKGSAATMVKQTIKFVDVEFGSQKYPIVGEVPHKLRMTNDDDDNKPLTNRQKTENVTKIIDLIKLLIKNVNQKEWKAYKFTTLVEMLQKVDRGTLDDIWVKCLKDEQLRQWLLEALRYVYNEDAFDFIADRIKSQALNTKQAVSVLLGFAFNTNPSEKICLNISELCLHSIVQGDETLKKTCYLTQGALMHEYCRKRGQDCFKNQALELKSRLLIADYQEKINLVKMIGNFGHRCLYRPLLDIIEDTANMLELRVTAVYALRRIAPRIPQKVLPVLLKIFRQVDNDVELRMACFVVICDSKPGPAVFNLIISHLQRERTNQVRSFVVSYIKGMAFSKYPCDEKMAKTARFALRMLRKHRMDLLKSKWFHWGQFSELLQLGGSVDLQMISTPSSFLPRSITSKVKVQMLGRSMNLFEAGVRGEGVQELLQRVVGPRPQSTGKKTLLSKLMLKSSYSFDKEVREINKMLPTAQYEEEKTKGSFYFKMMGKELFYNSFTDEDIKGFIDDGFLSMQGEFTELLRKGKVFNLTKVFLPMERMFVQPSVVGIPLKFTLQSVLFLHVNSTIKADMKETFFIPRQLSINGKLNISVLHSTWGKMKIYLPQLETGSKMKLEINITSGLGGSVNYNVKEGIYTTELDLPQEEQQIFSADKHGCTFLMYTKPVNEMMDRRSLYNSTRLDGLEIGEVAPIETFNDVVETFLFPTLMGPTDRHAHSANWTLRTQKGKYLSVNEHNELTLCEKPTVFRVIFIDNNRQFVKLFVPGKGYVKVKPNSKGCLEIDGDERFPKLFKITYIRGPRLIRLETVVFIHPNKTLNPTEWTETTAAMNTDQVLLFKNLIEDMREDAEVKEKWRYLTDLPLDDVQDHDRFHPRHMKLVFITPVEGKVCLRPNRSDETVFTVRRQRTQVNELCYGEQLLGMDVCLSGEYIKPFVPHPPVFPFSGPAKFNVSIKPGKTPARKIQFKFEKGDQFDDKYKTWKASMNLLGTNPEKKIESQITYDVNNKKTNISFDLLNMLPWLRRVCITSHVISDANATFNLEFGKSCGEYKMETLVNVVEPGRRQVDITTSYKLPDTVTRLFYKLFRAFSSQFRDRLSAYKIFRSERSQVQFVVKFKTEQLVDLEFIMPSRTLTMDDVRIETNGFIPHGNPIMNLMPSSSSVCTVDYNTYSTFDGVEFQYSSPRGCPHILAKDCANNSFMVLLSKEDDKTDDKIVEIFVDSHKIRVEYLKEGHYQIQVNGDVIEKRGQTIQVNSIATIVQLPEREELHVLCENGLQVIIVRGIKIDIRVSPFLFNRTCGMCGDLNAEQYQDLKTPRGLPYTCSNKQKYGHLWLVPDPHFRCSQGNCQLKKEYLKIPKTIDGEKFDCFTTTPVLRCLEDCQATESQITGFHLTCAKTNSKEVFKISDEIAKRTVDLTGRDVHFKENLVEHFACDCSACSQRNI